MAYELEELGIEKELEGLWEGVTSSVNNSGILQNITTSFLGAVTGTQAPAASDDTSAKALGSLLGKIDTSTFQDPNKKIKILENYKNKAGVLGKDNGELVKKKFDDAIAKTIGIGSEQFEKLNKEWNKIAEAIQVKNNPLVINSRAGNSYSLNTKHVDLAQAFPDVIVSELATNASLTDNQVTNNQVKSNVLAYYDYKIDGLGGSFSQEQKEALHETFKAKIAALTPTTSQDTRSSSVSSVDSQSEEILNLDDIYQRENNPSTGPDSVSSDNPMRPQNPQPTSSQPLLLPNSQGLGEVSVSRALSNPTSRSPNFQGFNSSKNPLPPPPPSSGQNIQTNDLVVAGEQGFTLNNSNEGRLVVSRGGAGSTNLNNIDPNLLRDLLANLGNSSFADILRAANTPPPPPNSNKTNKRTLAIGTGALPSGASVPVDEEVDGILGGKEARLGKVYNAIVTNDKGELQSLIVQGLDVNEIYDARIPINSPSNAISRTNVNNYIDARISPIQIAAAVGSPGMVEFLLENKADINQEAQVQTSQGSQNLTPLDIANLRGNTDVVTYLFNRGSEANISFNDLSAAQTSDALVVPSGAGGQNNSLNLQDGGAGRGGVSFFSNNGINFGPSYSGINFSSGNIPFNQFTVRGNPLSAGLLAIENGAVSGISDLPLPSPQPPQGRGPSSALAYGPPPPPPQPVIGLGSSPTNTLGPLQLSQNSSIPRPLSPESIRTRGNSSFPLNFGSNSSSLLMDGEPTLGGQTPAVDSRPDSSKLSESPSIATTTNNLGAIDPNNKNGAVDPAPTGTAAPNNNQGISMSKNNRNSTGARSYSFDDLDLLKRGTSQAQGRSVLTSSLNELASIDINSLSGTALDDHIASLKDQQSREQGNVQATAKALAAAQKKKYAWTDEQFKEKVMDIVGYAKFKPMKIDSKEKLESENPDIKPGELGVHYDKDEGLIRVRAHDLNGLKGPWVIDYQKCKESLETELGILSDKLRVVDEESKIKQLETNISKLKKERLELRVQLLDAKKRKYDSSSKELEEKIKALNQQYLEKTKAINPASSSLVDANRLSSLRKDEVKNLKQIIDRVQKLEDTYSAQTLPDLIDLLEQQEQITKRIGSPFFLASPDAKIPKQEQSNDNKIIWGIDNDTTNPYFIQLGLNAEKKRIDFDQAQAFIEEFKGARRDADTDLKIFKFFDKSGALSRQEILGLSEKSKSPTSVATSSNTPVTQAPKTDQQVLHKPLEFALPTLDFSSAKTSIRSIGGSKDTKSNKTFEEIKGAFASLALPPSPTTSKSRKDDKSKTRLEGLASEISSIQVVLKDCVSEFGKISAISDLKSKGKVLEGDYPDGFNIEKIHKAEVELQEFLNKNNLVNINRDEKCLTAETNSNYSPNQIIEQYYKEVIERYPVITDQFGDLYKASQAITKFKILEKAQEAVYDAKITPNELVEKTWLHKPLEIEKPTFNNNGTDFSTKVQSAFEEVKIPSEKTATDVIGEEKLKILRGLGAKISAIETPLNAGIVEFGKISSIKDLEKRREILGGKFPDAFDASAIADAETTIQDFLKENNLVNINRQQNCLSKSTDELNYSPVKIIQAYYDEVNEKDEELTKQFGTLLNATRVVAKYNTLVAAQEKIGQEAAKVNAEIDGNKPVSPENKFTIDIALPEEKVITRGRRNSDQPSNFIKENQVIISSTIKDMTRQVRSSSSPAKLEPRDNSSTSEETQENPQRASSLFTGDRQDIGSALSSILTSNRKYFADKSDKQVASDASIIESSSNNPAPTTKQIWASTTLSAQNLSDPKEKLTTIPEGDEGNDNDSVASSITSLRSQSSNASRTYNSEFSDDSSVDSSRSALTSDNLSALQPLLAVSGEGSVEGSVQSLSQSKKRNSDQFETSSVVSSLTNDSVKSQTYSSDGSNDSKVFDKLKLGSRTSNLSSSKSDAGVAIPKNPLNISSKGSKSLPDTSRVSDDSDLSSAESLDLLSETDSISSARSFGSDTSIPDPYEQLYSALFNEDRPNLNKAQEIIDDNYQLKLELKEGKLLLLHATFQAENFLEHSETIAKFLIDNDAKIDAQNKNGDTPLHFGLKTTNPKKIKETLKAIINTSKVNFELKNNENKTPIQLIQALEDQVLKKELAEILPEALRKEHFAELLGLGDGVPKPMPVPGKSNSVGVDTDIPADSLSAGFSGQTDADNLATQQALTEQIKALEAQIKKMQDDLETEKQASKEKQEKLSMRLEDAATKDKENSDKLQQQLTEANNLSKAELEKLQAEAAAKLEAQLSAQEKAQLEAQEKFETQLKAYQDQLAALQAALEEAKNKNALNGQGDPVPGATGKGDQGANLGTVTGGQGGVIGAGTGTVTGAGKGGAGPTGTDGTGGDTNGDGKDPTGADKGADTDKGTPGSVPGGADTDKGADPVPGDPVPGTDPVPTNTTLNAGGGLKLGESGVSQSASLLHSLADTHSNLSFESEYLGKNPVSGLLDHADVVRGTQNSWHAPDPNNPSDTNYPFTENSEICNTKAFVAKARESFEARGLKLEPSQKPKEYNGCIEYKSKDGTKEVKIPVIKDRNGSPVEYEKPVVVGDAIVNIPLSGPNAEGKSLALVYKNGELVGMKPPVNEERMFSHNGQMFIEGDDGKDLRIPMSLDTLRGLQAELEDGRGGPDNYQALQELKAYRNEFLQAQEWASGLKEEIAKSHASLAEYLKTGGPEDEANKEAVNTYSKYFINFIAAHEAEGQAFERLGQFEINTGAIDTSPESQELQKRQDKANSLAEDSLYIAQRHAELNELRQAHELDPLPPLEEITNAVRGSNARDSGLDDSGSSVSGRSNSGPRSPRNSGRDDDDKSSVSSNRTDRSSSLSSSSRSRRDSSASDDLDSLSDGGSEPENTTKNWPGNPTRRDASKTGAPAAGRNASVIIRKSLDGQGEPKTELPAVAKTGPKGLTVVASSKTLGLENREALEEHKKGSSSPGKVVPVNASTNRNIVHPFVKPLFSNDRFF